MKSFEDRFHVNNWYHFDTMNYGRCFTLRTPSDIDIQSVSMILYVNSTIIIHTPGMFIKANDGGQKKLSIPTELGKVYEIAFNFEYHQLLDVDYGGFPCQNEKEYQKDLCTTKAMEKQMLEIVGCTTPSQPDKSQICKQEDEGKRAMKINSKNINEKTKNGCSNPCSIFSLTTTNIKKYDREELKKNNISWLTLYFPKTVKVYERSYDYSQLSFIAEVGGYVGLFLGISINQVIDLLDYLVAKLGNI